MGILGKQGPRRTCSAPRGNDHELAGSTSSSLLQDRHHLGSHRTNMLQHVPTVRSNAVTASRKMPLEVIIDLLEVFLKHRNQQNVIVAACLTKYSMTITHIYITTYCIYRIFPSPNPIFVGISPVSNGLRL